MSVERNLIKTPYYSPWFLARNKIACTLQFMELFPAILSHNYYIIYTHIHVHVYAVNNFTVPSFSPAVQGVCAHHPAALHGALQPLHLKRGGHQGQAWCPEAAQWHQVPDRGAGGCHAEDPVNEFRLSYNAFRWTTCILPKCM